MPGIEELDPLLQSLQALKPPGASKSKITAITTICVENPQVDSTIAQKLYSHFKKTAPTHKLGILFVVDSVTRQWIDRARSAGQELSASAAHNGTYASGVQRLTELMPSLIDDLARVAPQDQKAKISNLVEIWDRGNTFPAKMIADFKLKLNGPQQVASATPPGSPPHHMLQSLGIRGAPAPPQSLNAALQPPAPAPDAAGLLAALAGLNKPQAPAMPQPPPPPAQAAPTDLAALLAGLGGAAPPPPPQIQQPPAHFAIPPQFQQSMPQMPPAMPVSAPLPPQLAAFMPTPPPVQAAAPPPAANPLAALAGLLPPSVLTNPQQLTQALTLFGELAKNNIPQEQWGTVLAALYPQAAPAQPAPVAPALQPWQQPQQQNSHVPTGPDMSRKRDRSRSPDRNRNGHSNGNRRPSPVYGTYNASNRDTQTQDDDGHGRRQGYRQRSPPRNNGGNAPTASANNRPKTVSHDPSLPPNTIRVLSRTLFVGGCMAPEYELREIFARFGEVQTCIANNDKRHAFVKMSTRKDALAAKAGMEELAIRDPSILTKARQTKWGVGFGPRDCCDYATGESIVPISSLTEADLKWALTAEYGGTGGQHIVPGMVIEEPDIEIGAGVSSKAMSKRLGPNEGGKTRGGRNGGQREGGRFRKGDGGHGGNQGGQQQQQQRFNSPRPQQDQPSTYQPPPPVPQFGFSFAMPGNNGPQY